MEYSLKGHRLLPTATRCAEAQSASKSPKQLDATLKDIASPLPLKLVPRWHL